MKRRLLFILFMAFSFQGISQIQLVEDLIPGSTGSNPNEFLEHDGLLFFRAGSPSGGALYKMDSGENITIAWQETGAPSYMTILNGELYFTVNNELHKLNVPYGTGSTIIDNTISVFGPLHAYNGELYFGGEQNQTDPLDPNYELMAYNGNTVRLVEDESSISLNPHQYVEHFGELYFVGEEVLPVNGIPKTINRIYKTDGATVEIVATLFDDTISYLSSVNNALYFLYRNGDFPEPYNLWQTNNNSTPSGFGDPLDFAFGLTVYDNKLYYFKENTEKLYFRDLSGEAEIPIANGIEYPRLGFPLSGDESMTFSGFTSTLGGELYTYASGGVIQFTEDYNPGNNSFTPVYGSFYNDKIYLSGDDGSGIGRELHVYQEPQNKVVEVSVTSGQATDTFGNYVITAGTNEITLGFNLEDENGNELPAGALSNYNLVVNTLEHPTSNSATENVDFGLLTDQQVNVVTVSNGEDGNQDITIGGDNLFEADEFFFIEVTTNDPNITLKNAVNGVVQIPVKIIDNEQTNITLSLEQNGAEPTQNATLLITSSLQNDSGAPMPFSITLGGGASTAVLGEDYQDLTNQPSIANGESSVEFDVIILNNDSEAETEEEFFANISYAGDLPSNRVAIQVGAAGVEVPIVDDGDVDNATFMVATSITGATGTGTDYVIEEGQTFNLNFDTGSTGTDGTIYDPVITITKQGIETTEDFTIDDINRSFTISTTNSDGSISFTANDDGETENDETYTITLASEDTSKYTLSGTTTFTVTIRDKDMNNGLFDVTVTLGGDVVNLGNQENPNYQINEGGTLLINVESSNSPENRSYNFYYDDNLSDLPDDFTRNFFLDNELSLLSFTTSQTQTPDIAYSIQVTKDGEIDNDGEQIKLNFEIDPNSIPEFSINNLDINETLNFTITIVDIDNTSSESIFANFENSGGTESETDTFMISLTERGEPWTNDTGDDIIFPVVFTNEKLDGSTTDLAEAGDYSPTAGNIVIGPNEATGSLTINLTDDADQEHEYYLATLQTPTSQAPITISNNTIEAKIIDKEDFFIINAKILGTTVIVDDPCCPQYGIEEGQLIKITLEAEKGVKNETPFDLQISYGGSAVKNIDFRNRDSRDPTSPDNIFGYSAKTDRDPDNTIEILIIAENNNTIENDDFSFSITSTNQEEYQLIGETGRQMSIIDVVPAVIGVKSPNAEEFPPESGELTISLDTETPLISNTKIFYEIDETSSASLADIEPLIGYVEIEAGSLSAPLIIKPINDNLYEEPESLRIRLIDGEGYYVRETDNISSITIKSDDTAAYEAKIRKSSDNRSRESDPSDFAELIVELDKMPDVDVEVVLKISDLTDQEKVIEGQDYTIFLEDKSTVLSSEDRTLLFKSGQIKTKSIFIKALVDNVPENNESLWLKLDSGVNYRIDTNFKSAEVELISSISNTSSFDPADIKLVAESPRCPGANQEGSIYLENDSPFDLDVSIVGQGDIVYNNNKNLDKGDSDENFQRFDGLAIGTYRVTMEFKDAIGEALSNVILPSYLVKIVPFDGMKVEEEGFIGELVSLKVSGSSSYAVTANGRSYNYEFNNELENTITVPLVEGLNDLNIKGDSECKGIIKKNIVFNSIHVYPNPTEDLVFLHSNSFTGKIEVQLFDMSGRLVYRRTTKKNTGYLSLNVATLERGMYLGVIETIEHDKIEFKLLKN